MVVAATMARDSALSGKRSGQEPWIATTHGSPAAILPAGVRDEAQKERTRLARAAVEARLALEEAVNAATLAAQRARSVSAALEEALAVLNAAETASYEPVPTSKLVDRTNELSPREREVLALVAKGRSNRAIAEELFVSPNTIKTHVASLLNKLHADTRVQLAVIAARQAAI